MTAAPPVVADRYRILEPLGVGGMGRVWRARDETLHRDVAVKQIILPPELLDSARDVAMERTLREARAAARLSHPNVVRVYDVLAAEGQPWIVMEYVPSRSLDQVIRTDGPLEPRRVAEIGLAVLDALRAAHRAGVDHRDIKPGNVLLADDGRVVLTDFGIARVEGEGHVTRTGLVLGSPEFIAPERAREGVTGPAGDLWSLGATLYAAVEGRSPFGRGSAMETLTALASEDPDPPQRAGALAPALRALLRKDPKARADFAQTEELLRRVLLARETAKRKRSWLGGWGRGGQVTPVLPVQRGPAAPPASAAPTPPATPAAPAARSTLYGRPSTAASAAGSAAAEPTAPAPATAVVPARPESHPPTAVIPPSPQPGPAADVEPSHDAEPEPSPEATSDADAAQADAATESSTNAEAEAEATSEGDATASASTEAEAEAEAETISEPDMVTETSTEAESAAEVASEPDTVAEAPTEAQTATEVASEPDTVAETSTEAAEAAANASADAEAAAEVEASPEAGTGADADADAETEPATEADPGAESDFEALALAAPKPEPVAPAPRQVTPRPAPRRTAPATRPVRTAPEPAVIESTPRPAGARRQQQLILGGVGAVLVIALIVWLAVHGDGGSDTTAGTTTPTPAGTTGAAAAPAPTSQSPAPRPSSAAPSSPAAPTTTQAAPSSAPADAGTSSGALPALPPGWTDYRDPTGFQVYVPASWRQSKDGSIVYFRGDGQVLGIDQSNHPQPDPVADWTQQEKNRAGTDFRNYTRVNLGPVDYFIKAADWEFTFDGSGGRQHVNNRGLIATPTMAYGIWWQTSDADWNADRPNLDLVFASFRPKR
ncbi:protein kinase [Dactylosporangium sp. NPDC051485]|uniref:protein kinase domain-containing protein n=1 Tax=Dactylosporangium sp. NPDC051485 TaxID=3154846 RepID=UPI00341F095A